MDPFIGAIIASGKAKYTELKYEITLEEALDIFEVIMVERYNEHLAVEAAKRKGNT